METKFKHPAIKIIGYCTLLALLILSIIFYKERTIFTDAAFQAFHLIKKGGFKIFHGRFGNVLVELLPLLAIKLKLSLKTVLILYSASYPLLFLIIYHIIVKYLKNEYMGMALVFTFTIIVYHSFYFMQSELYQGLAFLLLFFAIVYRYPKLDNGWIFGLCSILIIPLAFYHPLMMLTFIVIWVFFLLRDAVFRHWRYVALLVIMFIVVALNSHFFSSEYETIKKGLFTKNLVKFFPNYFVMDSHHTFIADCIKHYYLFPIILVITSLFYIKEKKWLRFLFVFFTPLGYIMLVHIASPQTLYPFYTEMRYLLLAVMVSIPFLFDVAPKIFGKKLMLFVFTVLMVIRINSIATNHKFYTDRLNWIEQQLELIATKYDGNKFIIRKDKRFMRIIKIEGTLPFESMLLSSLENPDSAKTIFIHEGGYSYIWDKAKEQVDKLVTSSYAYPTADFPKDYFNLKNAIYIEIKEEDVIRQ